MGNDSRISKHIHFTLAFLSKKHRNNTYLKGLAHVLDKRIKDITAWNGIKMLEDKDLIPKSQFCAFRFNVQGSASIIKRFDLLAGTGERK